MSVGTLLLIVLVVILIGSLPTWPYSQAWGPAPGGMIGFILVLVIVLVLLGKL